MEAAMGTVRKAGSAPAGVGMPLLASAAGHLALLAGILFWSAASGPHYLDAVTIVLVEGPAASSRAKGPETTAPAERSVRGDGILPRAVRSADPPDAIGRGSSREAPTAPSPAGGNLRAEGAPAAASGGPLFTKFEDVPRSVGFPGGGRAEGASSEATLPAPPRTASGGGRGAGAGIGRDGAEIRRLRERIESRIVYPEEAIRRGQEGEVLLRIRVGEGGIPKEIRVARSSGARTLDEAARNGVSRAAPLPSTPGWFEVPIRFSLR
ncbi:MAG: TonB family protein [Deltaproteobacteria bacterium]|nr:TonB family protein [Candidatus Deferrimicrobiaceae bacterium]